MSVPSWQVPTTRPDEDRASLWDLQQRLVKHADDLLGPRDHTIVICQPAFGDAGPHIIPYRNGWWGAELSNNAKGYWPTALVELAHETVHLLNPKVANTNRFEEGVAVEFSIYAYAKHTLKSPSYFEALQKVRLLPGGTFAAARSAREVAVALSTPTPDIFKILLISVTPKPCVMS